MQTNMHRGEYSLHTENSIFHIVIMHVCNNTNFSFSSQKLSYCYETGISNLFVFLNAPYM